MANEKIPYIMTESIVDLPAPDKNKLAYLFQNNDKKLNNFQKKVA